MATKCPSGKVYKCPSVGCGDHGVCNPCTGQCDCLNGWDGSVCEVPPPSNVACTPSDDAFKKAHNGGDQDCGNYGTYGVCNVSGTCDCGNTGFFGTRCQMECRSDVDCGGVGAGTKIIGRCNSYKQCECQNGWSGTQCRVAPPDAKCAADSDCGWGGTVNGKCLPDGKCQCFTDPTHNNRAMYEGVLCEKRITYEGADCEEDKDCRGGLKCNNNKCYDPAASPASKAAQALAIFQGLLSPEGIAGLYIFQGADNAVKYVLSQGLNKAISAALGGKMTDLVTSETLERMGKYLPEEMATRIMAKMAAKQATERTVGLATELIASGPLEFVFGFVDMLMVFGMILDFIDQRGLNQQMMQDSLTALKTSFERSFNDSESAQKANLVFPLPVNADMSVPFQAELATKTKQDQIMEDAAKYLSSLTVNSNGQVIRPLFLSQAQVDDNDRREKYKVYWEMSGHNEDVFNRLVSYGWVLWTLIAVLVVSIVLTCVFSNKAIQERLKK